ncbi:Ig-like domain-containing protein [Flavobacterium microcysteis]
MKKIVLLFVLLLPVFAFSQTTLVRWDGANLQANPYVTASNVSAGNITGPNVNFSVDNWNSNGNAFLTSTWPTSSTPDYSKYVQVSITANSGNKIDLSQFNFDYQNTDSNGMSRMQVYYSKNASFPSNGTVLYTNNSLNTSNKNFNAVSVPLTGITVQSGETVYIRITFYGRLDQWWDGPRIRIKHGYNDSNASSHNALGPVITGTVTPVCTPQGNPSVSPNGSWNGYVYSYSGTPAATTYLGYVTENETFDRNMGYGEVTGVTANLCERPTDYFFVSYKMTKSFPAGTYTFTVGGDDGYRLKINGESGYSINEWSDHGYTSASTTKTFSSTTNVTFVLEYYERAEVARVSFDYTCANSPTAPTTLTSNAASNTICSGNSVTLTAGGGSVNTSTYEWGTGTTVGSNVISGTGASITVSPTATTTYWVRRKGAAPCNFTTTGMTIQITVATGTAVAPTSITGVLSLCAGGSTTLTANGGSGSTYQWGTGTAIGSNIISGSGASITVSPSATTTYWVRRINSTPCSTPTSGVTVEVKITTPSGDPTAFGINSWNVYGYNVGSMTPTLANYAGYYTQNTLGVNTQDMANNGWNKETSPSSSVGWVGCPVRVDDFTMVHKRKGFPCGKYQLSMDNWDDETRVYVNGTAVFYNSGWSGENPTPSVVGTYALDSNSTIEVITREVNGSSNVKLSLTAVNAVYNGTSWSTSPEGAVIVVNGDLQLNSNLNVCSCTVNANKSLKVNSGVNLIVQNELVVAPTASVIIENNASLIQVNDNAANSGKITVRRNTTPVTRYDFTYWSSPVAAADWALRDLSPNTLADKYLSYNAAGNGWVTEMNGTAAMETGKGYIVRAPQQYSLTAPVIFETKFVGAPNNGVKKIDAKTGVTLKSNLIGNPYPSAISADKFYEANKGVIKGTFYFWTHNIAVSSTPDANGVYNYNPASYISYNATGATGSGDTNNCTTCGNTPSNKFKGNIASGQGFFVEGKGTGNIVFNNAMRVTQTSGNGQFYRNSNPNATQSSENGEGNGEEVTIEKNRLWLNITNAAGAYNEILVGYVTGATNNMDDAYDGITYASGTALYSLLDTNKLVIQGRSLPFSTADVVPLGFMAATAGDYSIGIESVDGLFEDQKVFLVDRLTNTVHNIKNDRYYFSTAAGTFNSRFEIRYVNEALGIDTPKANVNDIIVYKKGDQIAIKADNFTIDSVQILDLTGKEIFFKKGVNTNEFTTTGINVGTQVVVAKITLDDSQTVSKKVIMN